MNLLHPRWDGTRENLTVVSAIVTFLAWGAAFTEMPWWWALFPTVVTIALLWWEVKAHPAPPPPPLKELRRNRIGQLVSTDDPRPVRARRLP